MKQAKVLTTREIKRLLAITSDGRYAARNRVAIMLSYYAGMRVGEIAALTIGDIYTDDGEAKDQITLAAAITKTNETRRIFVSEALQKELVVYRTKLGRKAETKRALLLTQKRKPFTPNILCQTFSRLYKQAGIDGTSSHSGRRWFITRLAEGHHGTRRT